jgi:hypothetical protein
MKKLLFTALGALIIAGSSCTKPEDPGTVTPTPNPKTELELVIIDSTGTPAQAANVELYDTEINYQNRNTDKQIQGFHQSNSFGRCKYSSLSAKQYWFYVDKDGMTNADDVFTVTLVKDKLTTQPVHIK